MIICTQSGSDYNRCIHAGDIWEGVYSEDCYFGDPTVSFTGMFSHGFCQRLQAHLPMKLLSLLHAGLQKWRQNLQLLVPFLEDPQIELFSLKHLDSRNGQGAAHLQVGISGHPFEFKEGCEQQVLLCGKECKSCI